MNIRERILRVLAGQKPDKIPLCYSYGLIPSGSFERRLRNNGMGITVFLIFHRRLLKGIHMGAIKG